MWWIIGILIAVVVFTVYACCAVAGAADGQLEEFMRTHDDGFDT